MTLFPVHQLEREIFGKMGRLSELDSEIRQAETRVKGLRTMVFNLDNARQTVEQELDRIEAALRSDDLDDATKAQMQREERGLNEKLQGLLTKLDDKKDKLRDADDKLADLKQKLADTQKEYDDYQEQLRSAANDVSMVAVNKVGVEALGLSSETSAAFRWISSRLKRRRSCRTPSSAK